LKVQSPEVLGLVRAGADRRIRTNALLFCPSQEKRQTVPVARDAERLTLGGVAAA
jgi:hypothetical protein